jgi:hypothetical protein
MHVLKNSIVGAFLLPLLCTSLLAKNYKWSGKGQLYDQRNQYYVTCRLNKEKRVDPFFGEDSVKCFYTCTDKESMVLTTHSNHICEKQIASPRGEKRDWRNRLKY